jgi:hypothetical protein
VDPDCGLDAACPAACGEDSRFDVVRCRVVALATRTDMLTDAEPFSGDAGEVLAQAEVSAGDAEIACGAGDRKGARRSLKQVCKRAAKYGKKLRARPGRQAIVEPPMRQELVNAARTIRGLAKGLRGAVICAPPP